LDLQRSFTENRSSSPGPASVHARKVTRGAIATNNPAQPGKPAEKKARQKKGRIAGYIKVNLS